MLPNTVRLSLVLAILPVLAACGGRHRHTDTVIVAPVEARPVSVEMEVYDPATNFVWEDVSVRVLEADQEWSGCICVSPFVDWQLTDVNGIAFFDEFWLGDSEVGFVEDTAGGALLLPDFNEDEAVVTFELDGAGFTSLLVDVLLTWDEPDVFISVPF